MKVDAAATRIAVTSILDDTCEKTDSSDLCLGRRGETTGAWVTSEGWEACNTDSADEFSRIQLSLGRRLLPRPDPRPDVVLISCLIHPA